ncbi:hypothetical protein CKM354_000615200 [Cercospora kikuchii]|uniref:Uncharacterized protein n=1 Tax=Cercospora kikuchii TaxID=84275 RepID=A0A9P3CHC9_9PEZI|nr:uncharacterized protein CKM354_000615200 [Cercospora kikuchii]GIZ42904.1 hypothetical protein CKM354_000615200 [Cercospora kikuchii]
MPWTLSHLILCLISFSAIARAQADIGGLSGSHTDIPRWCGKPYEAGSPNFEPGGRLEPPAPAPSPLLHAQVQPHHSIYDSSEKKAQVIVDAEISCIHGQPLPDGMVVTAAPRNHINASFEFEIRDHETQHLLAAGEVPVGSRGNLVDIDLTALKPQRAPHLIHLSATVRHGSSVATYTAGTDFHFLPAKNHGSTVKIDNLNGGLIVANNATDYKFTPFLPFGFYTSCGGYLNYSLTNVTAYQNLGFNAINPVCAFTDGNLGFLFDWLDSTNLWYQYDMRHSYRNLSSVAEQIPRVKDRSNLLTWYTADEPDGWQYALNSTKLAYDLLKREDPYHPTGLALNCGNYYFEPYTSGADFIMEDAYPVSIDPNFSRKFNTTCNETYGDCGCDNCIGSLRDVSTRLDTYTAYEEWLERPDKPLWSVLQAFSGEFYWTHDPTPLETWVMMILSFNHNAKGMMSWLFPTSEILHEAHGRMARLLTKSPISDFLLGSNPMSLIDGSQSSPLSHSHTHGHDIHQHHVDLTGKTDIDVAAWSFGGQLMIMLANVAEASYNETVVIPLPESVSKIVDQPWGNLSYSLQSDRELVAMNVQGLSTSIVILDTEIRFAS